MTNPQVESLLRHEPFLRSLARHLLGDEAQAEDVVQQAWLVALKSAKRPEEVRPGWLAGIVRNLARRVRRDGERRARRERIAARACAVAPTDETCAERGLRRKIAEIVVALPPLYREPLLLRYYEGLAPHVIAERLALPGSTVRSRLQRGLALVRARLDASGGNGHALSLALFALATRRPARRVAALKAAGVLALVAATALVLGRPSPGPLRVAHEARAPAPLAGAGEGLAAAPADGVPGRRDAPAPARPLLLEGVVRLPAGAVERTVRLELAALPAGAREYAYVDGDAPFLVDISRAAGSAALRVCATHAEAEPAEVVLPLAALAPVDLTLRRRALVPDGKLAPDAEGLAAATGDAGAQDGTADGDAAAKGVAILLEGVLHLPAGARPVPALVEVFREGAAARARVRGGARFSIDVRALVADPRPDSLRVRASHPDAAPREIDVAVLFDAKTGAVVLPQVEIELEAAAFLEGLVELEGTGPVPDATVAAFDYDGEVPSEGVVTAAVTDAAGRYRLTVPRDRLVYVVAAAPAYAPRGTAVVATSDAVLPPFVLPRGATIEGEVRDAGEPAARATVKASLAGNAAPLALGRDGESLAFDAGGVLWRSVTAEADGGGAFSLRGLETRSYTVEVLALSVGDTPGFEAREIVAPGAVDFELSTARIDVVVLSEGAPLAGATVAVERARATLTRGTDALGRMSFLARAGERIRLSVKAEGFGAEERTFAAANGGAEIRFDLSPEPRLATLVVTLLPATGEGALPSRCAFELTPRSGGLSSRWTSAVEGTEFPIRDLEPGDYLVKALPGGLFLPARGEALLGRGETVELRLPVTEGGRILLRLLAPEEFLDLSLGGTADVARLVGPGAGEPWRVAGDMVESPVLLPGSYVLHVLGTRSLRSFPVDVAAGETTELTVGP
jgi:RNA polymerase sigma-70 factor (ECF subfamily)